MAVELAIYRADDYVPYERMPIAPMLREVFGRLLQQPLDGCRFTLRFLPVADDSRLTGEPDLVNLRSSHGYVDVRIQRKGDVVYQHPHPVSEIVGRPLQHLLAGRDPAETHWGYAIDGPKLSALRLTRPAPRVPGVMHIDAQPDRAPLFEVQEVLPPPPPEISYSDMGLVRPRDTHAVSVVLPEPIFRGFTSDIAFDKDVEDGGFLVGNVYRTPDPADHYLVQVTEVVPAERTGASMFHFTFTGESFLRINDRIARRADGHQLVGWYHTHLFPATEHFGLSSIDLTLHTSTFRRPWQVAALVNLTRASRALRFYATQDDGVEQTTYQVTA